ncbi:zinc-ribbon domain-containing protein [Mycetocola miduiensis]|uniref:Zinc-ribbon family protein n=1 Tax=Mycetocola miduiensis TaxID=995034 RepID=A0A1I5ADB9_9MICO|nr:zinc-ribbon domain-containing protein [Mycetocola miduiensis]SFN60209.1 zinc-ribbon family protein [Mycetocola miduiensis]
MLLIFGTTVRDRVLVVVRFICEYCRTDASQDVIESATKFSVFFLPLFTVGRRYVNVCRNCGGATPLTKEQATHGIEWAARNRQMT